MWIVVMYWKWATSEGPHRSLGVSGLRWRLEGWGRDIPLVVLGTVSQCHELLTESLEIPVCSFSGLQ